MEKLEKELKAKQDKESTWKEQRKRRPLGKTAEGDQLDYSLVIKKNTKESKGNIANAKDHYGKGLCEKCIEEWKKQKKWQGEGELGNKKRYMMEEEEREKKKHKRRIEEGGSGGKTWY